MTLERCCVCGDPIVDLPGQTAILPTYALEPGDAALAAGVVGPCWQSALIASPWGAHWAERLAAQYAVMGLIARPRDGAWRAFRSRNLPELTLLRDDGRQIDLRLDRPRRATARGLLATMRPRECNLHLGPTRAPLVADIQSRLRRDGVYPVRAIFDALGVARRLLDAETLADASLRFDAELAEYWTKGAVSALLEHSLFVPSAAAGLVASEPDQGPPSWARTDGA